MKKIIAMIGMGAVLCMVPSCKKSNIMPREAMASNQTEQRAPGLPLPDVENNTTLYVMLASKSCAIPQKEYTSLLVDIKGIEVFYDNIGWQTLPVVVSGWDLVAMQQSTIPGLNLTKRVAARAGTISQVIVTFGDNNKLAFDGKPACFKLGTQRVTLDLKGDVQQGAVNELLLAMDICGNIGVQENSDGTNCYILKPVVDFGGISQKKIK